MFAVIAMVVILAGWYLLLWSPAARNLDKAQTRRQSAQQRQVQLQAEIDRLQSAQKSEPQNRAKLETLRTAIPDDPALGEFIINVNDAAAKAGIDFVSIAPSLPKAGTAAPAATTGTTVPGTVVTGGAANAPAEIVVQFQVGGGYFQVLDFLNRLDALPRLVVTDSINISADPGGALTVGVSARMFVRSVPAGFAGATATSTTVAGGSTTTTAPGGTGSTTTTAAGGVTTTTGARP
jgi:Tfp pilus assembly protein PilO